jgi:SAM-dependent methyltransferase
VAGRPDPASAVLGRGFAPGELRRTSCPLCGGATLRPVLELQERMLLECPDCGVRCTEVYGEPSSIRRYYTQVQAHQGKAFVTGDGDALRAIARAQADWMEGVCGPRRFGRFCEIGCSRGYLLGEMEARGWDVAGVEVSASSADEARQRCRGPIHLGEPEDLPFGEGSFDRIAMLDVLAHLAHPVRTLEAVGRMLKPGGDLIISSVDESWPLVPLFVKLFRALPGRTAALRAEMYEGQHYCYFGRDNVGRLLEAAGLELSSVRALEPLSARFFVHHYGWRRRLALLSMVRMDRLLGSGRKMLVLATKPRS